MRVEKRDRFGAKRKFDLDYHESVSAIIDWLFANNEEYLMNLDRIATLGFSLGGHLAPLAG